MSERQMMRQIYQHGDIGGVPNRGLLGRINRAVFHPHTDLYHFFLVADYVPEEDDYVILESTARGVGVGRLSWYEDYRIFRVNAPMAKSLGVKACRMLTKHGRAGYDHLLFAKLLLGCLGAWLGQLFRLEPFGPINPWQLSYGRNSRFICTEAANEAWAMVGYPVIPRGMMPLPAGFEAARICGKLLEVSSK